MARCGLLVWLWIRVTVRPEKRKRNVEMAPPRAAVLRDAGRRPRLALSGPRRGTGRVILIVQIRVVGPGPPRGRRRRPGTGVCPSAPPCARPNVTCEKAPRPSPN